MISTRTLPWMKLGTVVDEPMSPREALKKAKLDWKVDKQPVYRYDKKGNLVEIDDRFVTVRSRDDRVFDVVSSTYETFQNVEAFEFLEPLTANGDLLIHAAGEVRRGRQVFVVAEAPDALQVFDDDPHQLYVVIRTGHDGTKAVQVLLMGLRGLCMNMLGLPSFAKHAKQRWSLPHVSTLKERLAEAQTTLQGVEQYAAEFATTAERLASIDIEVEEFTTMLRDVIPTRPKTEEQIGRIGELMASSPTIQDHYRNTGWGAVNALEEYMDWGRERSTDEGRFHTALDGTGARYRNRVTALLLAR